MSDTQFITWLVIGIPVFWGALSYLVRQVFKTMEKLFSQKEEFPEHETLLKWLISASFGGILSTFIYNFFCSYTHMSSRAISFETSLASVTALAAIALVVSMALEPKDKEKSTGRLYISRIVYFYAWYTVALSVFPKWVTHLNYWLF